MATTKKDYEITPMKGIAIRCFGKEGKGIITRLIFLDDGFYWHHHLGISKKGFHAENDLYFCHVSWNEFPWDKIEAEVQRSKEKWNIKKKSTTKKEHDIMPIEGIEVRCFGKKGRDINRLMFSDYGFEWQHLISGKNGFSAKNNINSCKITWREFNQVMRDFIKERDI